MMLCAKRLQVFEWSLPRLPCVIQMVNMKR